MAKENLNLKDEGEPIDGFLVLHIDGEYILENCLKIFDFEQDEDSQQEGNCYIEHFPIMLSNFIYSITLKNSTNKLNFIFINKFETGDRKPQILVIIYDCIKIHQAVT